MLIQRHDAEYSDARNGQRSKDQDQACPSSEHLAPSGA
jgi:hypothetical protein